MKPFLAASGIVLTAFLFTGCDVLEQVSGRDPVKDVVRDNPVDPMYGVPENLETKAGIGVVSATWNPVEHAKRYRVYFTTTDEPNVLLWSNFTDVDITTWVSPAIEPTEHFRVAVAAVFPKGVGRYGPVVTSVPAFRAWSSLWKGLGAGIYLTPSTAAAASENGFLMALRRVSSVDSGYFSELVVRRIGLDGKLSSENVLLSINHHWPDYPSNSVDCASDGEGYAVVWDDKGMIRLLLLSSSGTLLNGPLGVVLSGEYYGNAPRVSFGAGVYLVCWEGSALHEQASIVSPEGEVLATIRLPFEDYEDILFDGQQFWVFHRTFDREIVAVRVGVDGISSDSVPLTLMSSVSNLDRMSVASDENGFLVAWSQSSDYAAIRYRFFSLAGNPLGGIGSIGTPNSGYNNPPRFTLAPLPEGYRMVWTVGVPAATSGTLGLYRATLPPGPVEGEPSPLGHLDLAAEYFQPFSSPTVRIRNGVELTTWGRSSEASDQYYDVLYKLYL